MIVSESILEHVQVTFSDDGTRAFIMRDESLADATISGEILMSILEEKGVVFGLQRGIERAFGEAVSSRTPVLVAEGLKPVDGVDGWAEYLIDPSSSVPLEEQGGRVDLHNLHRLHNVKKGERLAIVHPPVEGVSGMSVKGLPIASKSAKKARVYRGTCVGSDPGDSNVWIATEDGNLVIKPDGTVEVQPTVTIRGDIDFSTGDIDFIGSLVVTGDIKSDFSVKVQKNLEVRGDVEDATIVAGGSVLIKKGFFGRGKGSISAGGNVSVQHVLNQSIIGEKNVTVEREAVCAKITAGDAVVSPRAKIVGCVVRGGNQVEVLNLGNGDSTQATVFVGKRTELIEKRLAVEKELDQLGKQADEFREYIYKLVRAQLDGPLTDEQSQLLEKLKRMQAEIPERIALHQTKRNELEIAIQATTSARIIVRGTVFVNVLVDVNGVKKLMHNSLKEVMFAEKNGKVEEQSLPTA